MFAVKWDDAYQEVDSTCTDIEVLEPYQEVSHKKKCLLSNPDADLDTGVLKDLELPDKVPVELDDPICEKGPFGTMINLADHMTTDHSFEESGELKADLSVDKRGNGKQSYEMFLNYQWFLMVANLGP